MTTKHYRRHFSFIKSIKNNDHLGINLSETTSSGYSTGDSSVKQTSKSKSNSSYCLICLLCIADLNSFVKRLKSSIPIVFLFQYAWVEDLTETDLKEMKIIYTFNYLPGKNQLNSMNISETEFDQQLDYSIERKFDSFNSLINQRSGVMVRYLLKTIIELSSFVPMVCLRNKNISPLFKNNFSFAFQIDISSLKFKVYVRTIFCF